MSTYTVRLGLLTMALGVADSDGDAFVIDHIDGIDSSDVDFNVQQRNLDGSIVTSIRYKERPLTIIGNAYSVNNASFDVLRIRLKLEAAAQLVTAPGWLYLDDPSPGIPTQMLVQRSGKLHMQSPNHNVQHFELEVTAVDPRKYGQSLNQATINGGPVTVTQAGNYDSYPIATLLTLASNPDITNAADGTLSFTGANIPVGSYIDFQNKKTVNATTGLIDAAARPRHWWALHPGPNTISSHGQWRLNWRSAYV